MVLGHGVGYGAVYTPGYASGVTHYDTYGTGPSYGHTNLRQFNNHYATPIYKTLHYYRHHGHGYGHGHGGSVTYPAGALHHHNSGFDFDTYVQHPGHFYKHHSTSYETPVPSYGHASGGHLY